MSIVMFLAPIGSAVLLFFFVVFGDVRLRWKVVALVVYGASWAVPATVPTYMPIQFVTQALLLIALLIYFKYLYL